MEAPAESKKASEVAAKAVRIPLRATKDLVDEANVRLALLQLFQVWDTNNNRTLDLTEVVWGMSIAGLKCDARSMARAIFEISKESGDVSEEDLKSLKNHEFVKFMLRPEMLGGRSPQAQLECIDIILKGLRKGSKVAMALREKIAHVMNHRERQPEARKTAR